jgi:Chain length determinant protein
MDLISIVQVLWRHKFFVLPVVLLTCLGAFYIVKVKPPVYQASTNILLINPNGPPTLPQIKKDPALKYIPIGNPYNTYGTLAVIADVAIQTVTSGDSVTALVKEGVSPRFQVAMSTDYQFPPEIVVTGVGPSAAAAIQSATLIAAAVQADIRGLQVAQGVYPYYMIKSALVVPPGQATYSVSSKLRSLIAVLALGMILLFVVISVVDAIEKRRTVVLPALPEPSRAPSRRDRYRDEDGDGDLDGDRNGDRNRERNGRNRPDRELSKPGSSDRL